MLQTMKPRSYIDFSNSVLKEGGLKKINITPWFNEHAICTSVFSPCILDSGHTTDQGFVPMKGRSIHH